MTVFVSILILASHRTSVIIQVNSLWPSYSTRHNALSKVNHVWTTRGEKTLSFVETGEAIANKIGCGFALRGGNTRSSFKTKCSKKESNRNSRKNETVLKESIDSFYRRSCPCLVYFPDFKGLTNSDWPIIDSSIVFGLLVVKGSHPGGIWHLFSLQTMRS